MCVGGENRCCRQVALTAQIPVIPLVLLSFTNSCATQLGVGMNRTKESIKNKMLDLPDGFRRT